MKLFWVAYESPVNRYYSVGESKVISEVELQEWRLSGVRKIIRIVEIEGKELTEEDYQG